MPQHAKQLLIGVGGVAGTLEGMFLLTPPPPPPPTGLTKYPNQGGGGARGFSPPVLYAVYIKHCPGVSLCPSSQIACTEWRHGERRRRVEKALCTLYNRVD